MTQFKSVSPSFRSVRSCTSPNITRTVSFLRPFSTRQANSPSHIQHSQAKIRLALQFCQLRIYFLRQCQAIVLLPGIFVRSDSVYPNVEPRDLLQCPMLVSCLGSLRLPSSNQLCACGFFDCSFLLIRWCLYADQICCVLLSHSKMISLVSTGCLILKYNHPFSVLI